MLVIVILVAPNLKLDDGEGDGDGNEYSEDDVMCCSSLDFEVNLAQTVFKDGKA